MDDRQRDTPSGGFFRPFIPGESSGSAQPSPADDAPAAPLGRGSGNEPEVITDQVAGLAPLAVELPSITQFMYDEPTPSDLSPQHGSTAGSESEMAAQEGYAPPPAQRVATPASGFALPATRPSPPAARVPPLPGFSPTRGTPAPQFPDPTSRPATPTQWPPAFRPTPEPTPAQGIAGPGDDWGTGEWQRYDWRSAASLAPDERARAAEAWADLDWESDSKSRARQRNESVAAALEEIARRVRSGELPVHGHPGMSEEAAAAAALAAILARRS